MSYKEIINLHGPEMEICSISRFREFLPSFGLGTREKMFGVYLNLLSGEGCVSSKNWDAIPKAEKTELQCCRFGNFVMILRMERPERLSQIPSNSLGFGVITIQKPDGGFLEYQVNNLWYLRSVIAGCEFVNVFMRATLESRNFLGLGWAIKASEDKEKFLKQFSGAQIVRDVCSAYLDRRWVSMSESIISHEDPDDTNPIEHFALTELIRSSHAHAKEAILRVNGEEHL